MSRAPLTKKELNEAFIDCVAHLAGAISAYETFAGNVARPGRRDALFSTRINDYKKALDRARKTARRLNKEVKREEQAESKSLGIDAAVSPNDDDTPF